MKKRMIVVALGGNALTPKKGRGDYKELAENIKKACESLVSLLGRNQIALTHGSGPQIGSLLLQNELTKNKIAPMPMDVLDAELEGELGYLIAQSLNNTLAKHCIRRPVISIITRVLVDKRDPLFKKPTKPVGPFYTKEQAAVLRREGFTLVDDAGRGYRKVVPSPAPKKIIEADAVAALVRRGYIVIAAGGGGIPVYRNGRQLKGIAAVIDKDLASACLAKSIGADVLIVLTGVDCVYVHYGTARQAPLARMTAREARRYLQQGEFPEGSMGPKIAAALDFLAHGGKEVLITSPDRLPTALRGRGGTLIVP